MNMPPRTTSNALVVSRRVLGVLIPLNIVMGGLILALLIASEVAEQTVMHALGVLPGGNPALFIGMRMIMVLGIAAVPLTHTILVRLLAIVETVGAGDPFIVENAARLQKIAWTLLALEGIHLVIVAVAARVSTKSIPVDMGETFSVTRWLAVLLLFVLARVFETGARMREDLEGTV